METISENTNPTTIDMELIELEVIELSTQAYTCCGSLWRSL